MKAVGSNIALLEHTEEEDNVFKNDLQGNFLNTDGYETNTNTFVGVVISVGALVEEVSPGDTVVCLKAGLVSGFEDDEFGPFAILDQKQVLYVV